MSVLPPANKQRPTQACHAACPSADTGIDAFNADLRTFPSRVVDEAAFLQVGVARVPLPCHMPLLTGRPCARRGCGRAGCLAPGAVHRVSQLSTLAVVRGSPRPARSISAVRSAAGPTEEKPVAPAPYKPVSSCHGWAISLPALGCRPTAGEQCSEGVLRAGERNGLRRAWHRHSSAHCRPAQRVRHRGPGVWWGEAC